MEQEPTDAIFSFSQIPTSLRRFKPNRGLIIGLSVVVLVIALIGLAAYHNTDPTRTVQRFDNDIFISANARDAYNQLCPDSQAQLPVQAIQSLINLGKSEGISYDISGQTYSLVDEHFFGDAHVRIGGTITVTINGTKHTTPAGSSSIITLHSAGFGWCMESPLTSKPPPTPTPTSFQRSHFSEFTIPDPDPFAWYLAAGPDGNLWFTEYRGGLGRITPTGHITEFPLPTSGSQPQAITTGPDGNLWFIEEIHGRIGRITPSGQITEFSPPVSLAPYGQFQFYDDSDLTVGPDKAIWFTTNNIGRISLDGKITEFPVQGGPPAGIATGPDGNIWFTVAPNKIGRMTPTGQTTMFPLPQAGNGPAQIIAGPDGNLWFIESYTNRIGRITPTGQVTLFSLPNTGNYEEVTSIASGPDGALWFTDATLNRIGRITTAGSVSWYPLPTSASELSGITVGPDGAIWYTHYDHIGRFKPGA